MSESRNDIIDVIQKHFEAYNRHDINAFAACFSETVEIFRPPSVVPNISNKAELIHFYSTQRFSLPGLRAELLNRMQVGNKVIDHERVYGLGAHPVEAMIANEVVNGLIQRVWVYA